MSGDGGVLGRAIRGAAAASAEIPTDCVYDAWGADFGVQAGARCLNADQAHQDAHHGPTKVKSGIEESGVSGEVGEPVAAPLCYHAAILNQPCRCNEAPAPWRFDVPEVPDSVTALRDRDGDVWLRQEWPRGFAKWPGTWWACQHADGDVGPTAHFTDIVSHAPLEEHPDPRAAS